SNVAGLVAAAGALGTSLSKGFGTVASASGGNSDAATVIPELSPVFVRTVDDVIGAVLFGGQSLTDLTPDQPNQIARPARDLSSPQRAGARNKGGGRTLYDRRGCAYAAGVGFASGASQLDPRQDAAARQIFGLAVNTPPSDMNAVAASVITNAIQQRSGPGV